MSIASVEETIEQNILKSGIGITFESIYKSCPDIDDKISLSKMLKELIEEGKVIKIGLIYRHKDANVNTDDIVEETPSMVEDEIKKLMPKVTVKDPLPKIKEPKVFVSKTQRTSIPEAIKPKQELLEGTLKRSEITGGFVYGFFKFRQEGPLSIDDIKTISGKKPHNVYDLLAKLVKKGYINKLPKGEYIWSGKFKYPFPDFLKEDENLIKFTPLTYDINKHKQKEIALGETNNDNIKSISDFVNNAPKALELSEKLLEETKKNSRVTFIDYQIEILERQIANLKAIKADFLAKPL